MAISLPGCFCFFLESILANYNLFISPTFLYLYAKFCHDISSYLLIFKDMCIANAAIIFLSTHLPLFPSSSSLPLPCQGQGFFTPPLSCLPKKVFSKS